MSTLVINYKKQAKIYFGISLFCLIFGIIYEQFSHDVYSNYMMHGFIIPLITGTIYYFIYKFNINFFNKRYFNNFINSSIATFTTACYLKGILDIYGTTNSMLMIYVYMGTVLLILSVISLILEK